MTGNDMNDIKIQSLMSLLVPGEGESVAMFIATVAKAFGSHKDSTVADVIGVPRSAIANWKRRNSIPADYRALFTTAVIEKIVGRNHQYSSTHLEARMAFLRMLQRTNGDPYGLGDKGEIGVANSIPGLLALSQFLMERLYSTCSDERDVTVDAICDMLITSMFSARHADHLRALQY